MSCPIFIVVRVELTDIELYNNCFACHAFGEFLEKIGLDVKVLYLHVKVLVTGCDNTGPQM